jgi:hypothetical protein
MEDKRFQENIPEDPSFEEMEEILREIKELNERPEIVIRLEIQPSRY